jgi:hypothetical protein
MIAREVALKKRNQTLSSGLVVQQDFSESVRAVFFQTEFEDFLYATHGGTLFLVSFRGRVYALTCKHVFGDFPEGTLFITQEKQGIKGSKPAPVAGAVFPSAPVGEAVGTDVTDICVIQFADDMAPDFFKGGPYIIDENTVGTSKAGHQLLVAGVLKDKTQIIPPDITMGFCLLELRDAGPYPSDPFLRHAEAQFSNPAFDNVTGISGAPVFDQTASVLCGMVVRGGMVGNHCSIKYIDIFDITKLLEGVSNQAERAFYTKGFSV